jgi:hypothetical protein
MRHTFIIGTGAALTLAAAAAVFANTATIDAGFEAPGYSVVQIAADHREAPVEVHIWYPTDGMSDWVTIGDNILFNGFDTQLNCCCVFSRVRREGGPIGVAGQSVGGPRHHRRCAKPSRHNVPRQ